MKIAQTTTSPASQDAGDFRTLLQTELARRCTANARYSLRAFAQDLKIDHSTLSQLLRERRAFTARSIRLIGGRLGLSAEILGACVARERTLGEPSAAALREVRQLTGDAAAVVADLSHYAILELVRLKSFKPDSRWIGRVLGLSVDEVNTALSRLLRLGLLEMRAAGTWVDRTGDSAASLDGLTHVTIQQLTQRVGRLREIAMEHVPARLRDHSSTTLAVDTAKLASALELIRRFRLQLAELLATDGPTDDVYQLEISLFPITNLAHSRPSRTGRQPANRASSKRQPPTPKPVTPNS